MRLLESIGGILSGEVERRKMGVGIWGCSILVRRRRCWVGLTGVIRSIEDGG